MMFSELQNIYGVLHMLRDTNEERFQTDFVTVSQIKSYKSWKLVVTRRNILAEFPQIGKSNWHNREDHYAHLFDASFHKP